ncbi:MULTISPECIES: hypothetical protein [unclassified Arsenophonus]|uniref:hypothetical protein n=1 Tax=unclassified Arsenophonus TaxID=2627083 RepID=UPI0028562E97|nr:hypothetical protein [Arsenophonus sp.]MDR5610791.1 hypothetical protein [Arsenophonus sp.]MDR5614751.1 hypothetical protein [Arsenophonus sp.]
MSVWDNFYRLDYLDLAFVKNSSAQKATIYGNGQNRIALSLKVKIVDKNNNPLVIPADELLNRAHLVQFRNGQRLNWEGSGPDSRPWVYTWRSNDYIHLRAMPAISYNHGENVVIVKREVIQVSAFNWQSRYSVGGPYADHSNGQVWRGDVIFSPSKEIGVNPTFKEWEVNYTAVTNNTLNKDSINWGPDMHCFDAIPHKPFPCAVMHRGAGRAESHLIFWYPSIGGEIVINGHYILQDSNYYY